MNADDRIPLVLDRPTAYFLGAYPQTGPVPEGVVPVYRVMMSKFGYQHKSDLYDRTLHMLSLIGWDTEDEDNDEMTRLRYFIEYITQGYTHDPDPESVAEMKIQFGPKS